MLRCRLRFFQRLICLAIIIIGAALIVLYRYHELGVLKSDEYLQIILNRDNEGDKLTSKPVSSPMVVYKKKINQDAANNGTKTLPAANNGSKTLSVTSAWHVWRTWPQSTELYSEKQFNSSAMRDILHHMTTAPIVRFDVGYRGTQLKALMELEGGQLGVFKPKRYDLME